MTDKVQKIKEWISKEQDGLMDANGNFEYPEHEGAYHILCNLDAYIDSMQEEPKFKTGDRIKPIDSCLGSQRTIVDVCDSWYVTDQGTLDFEFEDNWELAEEHKKCMYSKDDYTDEDRKVLCDGCEEECRYAQKEESVGKRFSFKAIPRLLEMIEPTDRAKVYVTKLADALEVEGYSTDAKIVMESLKIMNGEKVPMATMDEEPVSKDLEKAAVEAFKQIVDSDKNNFLEIFKAGAEWQKTKYESTTEDLGEYINELSKQFPEVSFAKLSRIAVRVAKWQKEKMMANAVEGVVHHFEKCGVASVHYNDPTGVPMAYFTSPEGLSAGDKVKIIVIKED